MNDYFQGAVTQHIERGRGLINRIPIDLSREFHALATTCRSEISRIINELQSVRDDPKMQNAEFQPERLRQFRRAVSDLALLEQTGLVALERGKEDKFLNQLVENMRREICHPLLPPAVCALSQNYFHIYTSLNLMFVPLSEGDFLLHLPDLYHELAHPLFTEQNNPRVKPFQDAFFAAYGAVIDYILNEQKEEERRSGRAPSSFVFYLQTWRKSWWRWLSELYCDLFATFTLGPAYGWSHFYLCGKIGTDPFSVPTIVRTTHPSDDARMRVILLGLVTLGFQEEVSAIRQRWHDLLLISGAKVEPEYHRCYPDSVLQQIVKQALEGVKGIGCRIATKQQIPPIAGLLNQAWQEFWRAPSQFPTWEHNAVEQLREIARN